jgi:hypothetical protein
MQKYMCRRYGTLGCNHTFIADVLYLTAQHAFATPFSTNIQSLTGLHLYIDICAVRHSILVKESSKPVFPCRLASPKLREGDVGTEP